jgi:hypothetical protein
LAEDGVGRDESCCLVAAGVAARHLVGPFEQPLQVGVGGGRDDARVADDDLATGPVRLGR